MKIRIGYEFIYSVSLVEREHSLPKGIDDEHFENARHALRTATDLPLLYCCCRTTLAVLNELGGCLRLRDPDTCCGSCVADDATFTNRAPSNKLVLCPTNN
jgi:hypothetical protein